MSLPRFRPFGTNDLKIRKTNSVDRLFAYKYQEFFGVSSSIVRAGFLS